MDNKTWSLEVVQQETSALAVFTTDNIDKIVEAIRTEVSGFEPNVNTAKGRKEIASLAHKVSRSKTALDTLGKNLVSDWKTKAKKVDKERKYMRDSMDAIRDDVRKPLNEWDAAEKKRKEDEAFNNWVLESHESALKENALIDRAAELERREAEIRQAEEERKAKEEAEIAEKRRIEREQQIARDAAEAERKKAELAILEAEREKQRAIEEARLAEERAEQEKQAAEERRIRELEEQKEQLRIEELCRKEEEEDWARQLKELEEKKAADKKHQREVNLEILKMMISIGIENEKAKKLIAMIVRNEIPNLTVNY
jgi:hypothetical protein